jgi:hypothetical protein
MYIAQSYRGKVRDIEEYKEYEKVYQRKLGWDTLTPEQVAYLKEHFVSKVLKIDRYMERYLESHKGGEWDTTYQSLVELRFAYVSACVWTKYEMIRDSIVKY